MPIRPTGRWSGRCRLLLDDQLGVAGDARAEVGWESDGLVERIVCRDCVWPCVAAIASMHVRTTLLKTSCAVSDQPEVWLCVRSESDFGFCAPELLDQPPRATERAQLGHLHEEVHPDGPEEAQAAARTCRRRARPPSGPDVFDAVREGVGQLEVLRRPGLLHVIAGDRDRVERGIFWEVNAKMSETIRMLGVGG